MQLEKPRLFADQKSLFLFLAGLAIIIGVRLFFLYGEYREFVNKPFYFTYANVLSQKEKSSHGKRYKVLKLRTDDRLQFLTTSYQKISYEGKRLRLEVFPDKSITFFGYLGTFFVRSKIKEIITLPATYKERLLERVAMQHNDPSIASFYNAIFFATPLEEKIRENVAKLGISHLVALSGFHLTILWGLVYGVLLIAYRPMQQKYFPYRFSLIDVGITTLAILAFYLWFTGFPPSLVRAYGMVLTGWLLLIAGIELLTFAFLFAVVFALLALFPSLIASLSFGLSVAGVFMIFLIVKYTQGWDKRILGYVLMPIGIFVLMQPIVHGIFGLTTPYQLLSPLLSVVFVPFYPLAMGLHLVGYGALFDNGLMWLSKLPQGEQNLLLPGYMVMTYIVIGLMAIRSGKLFIFLVGLAACYTGYLYLV